MPRFKPIESGRLLARLAPQGLCKMGEPTFPQQPAALIGSAIRGHRAKHFLSPNLTWARANIRL